MLCGNWVIAQYSVPFADKTITRIPTFTRL